MIFRFNPEKKAIAYTFIVLFLMVSIFNNNTLKASAAISDWQRGASIQPTSPTQFSSSSFKQSLMNLKADNANYVNLVLPIYQTNIRSSDIAPGGDTPTDASIISAIDTAHSLGLKVSLKPHIESKDGQWRANIDPNDRKAWFAAYGSYMVHFATLAQAHQVEQLIMGTELVDLSSDAYNPENTSSWRMLISKVRNVYSGSLLYAANWGPTGTNLDEKNNIQFWDLLDTVGIDSYYPLGSDYGVNSVEALRSYWAVIDSNDIQLFQKKVGKPILFTEIGYRSTGGAHIDPGNYQHTDGVNLTEQANLYEALFSYWNDKNYIKGIHIWNWDGNPNAGGSNDVDYTPQNKPAETILKKWFGFTGSVAYPIDPIPAAPSFNATTNLSPDSAINQFNVGNTISFNSTITDVGGGISGLIADIEIYDSNGNKVFQTFAENQSFNSSSTNSYPVSWTTQNPGTYSVKIGVFNSNWSKNFLWQTNAGQFNVGSSVITKAPTFLVSTSSVTNAMVNQSLTLNTVVSNSIAAASNILYDVEVYDQTGKKNFQKVYDSQNFNLNESKNFSTVWTPSSSGNYVVKLGVFNNDWSKNYVWNDKAMEFTISAPVVITPVTPTPPVIVPPVATTTPPVSPIASSSCPTTIPTNSWIGCYFNDVNFTAFKLTRLDSKIDFDWGGGSPDSTINSDNFSTSWQGNFTFDNAEYTFNTLTDDGVRLYIDNQIVLSKWMDQVASYQVKQNMTSGTHLIKVEYYDHSGGARASINWIRTGPILTPPSPVATSTPPVQNPPADVVPPIISNGAPTGTLNSDSTSTILSVSTDENALCRYSINNTSSYASMNVFETTGTKNHASTISGLTNGKNYTYYIRCADTIGNTSASGYIINFAVALPIIITPPPTPTPPTPAPAASSTQSYSLNIWWPTNGATVSGSLPLKVLAENVDISKYFMFWQVEGGTLNTMYDSYSDYQHKEAWIDVSGWNWKPDSQYVINFVAKDARGNVLGQKSTTITVTN